MVTGESSKLRRQYLKNILKPNLELFCALSFLKFSPNKIIDTPPPPDKHLQREGQLYNVFSQLQSQEHKYCMLTGLLKKLYAVKL